MKSFYEAIIASGGFAGEVFDVAQGPANLDIINTLLSVGNGTLTGNAPVNLISTGALGAPRSLFITSIEQNGRWFFLSARNTDLTTNPLTVIASTDINSGGPSLIINTPTDYIFIHESAGIWRAYIQSFTAGDSEEFIAMNKDVVTIKKGQPVAIHSSGSGVVLAAATSLDTLAIGLATADIPAASIGPILTDGPLLVSDWTAAVGSVSLTAKKQYYLSATTGKLTINPPSSSTNVSQPVGKATDTQTLNLFLLDPTIIG